MNENDSFNGSSHPRFFVVPLKSLNPGSNGRVFLRLGFLRARTRKHRKREGGRRGGELRLGEERGRLRLYLKVKLERGYLEERAESQEYELRERREEKTHRMMVFSSMVEREREEMMAVSRELVEISRGRFGRCFAPAGRPKCV